MDFKIKKEVSSEYKLLETLLFVRRKSTACQRDKQYFFK